MAEKKVGDKIDCGTCGAHLICRMSNYGGKFPDKPQYQDEDGTKAHFDKFGNCKNKPVENELEHMDDGPETIGRTSLQKVVEPIIPKSVNITDDYKIKISVKARLLWYIRLQVEATIKGLEDNPNGGMIWEMTKIIYSEMYGGNES